MFRELWCRACKQRIKWYQRKVWYYCPPSERDGYEIENMGYSAFHRNANICEKNIRELEQSTANAPLPEPIVKGNDSEDDKGIRAEPEGEVENCSFCNGTGHTMIQGLPTTEPCRNCKGSGVVTLEKEDWYVSR